MERNRFVPLEKQSKKARRKHYAARRGDWNGVVPVTRVIPNKKKRETHAEYSYAVTEE